MSFDPLAQLQLVLGLRRAREEREARDDEKKQRALQAGIQIAQNPYMDVQKAAVSLKDLDPTAMPFLLELQKATRKQAKEKEDREAATAAMGELDRISPLASQSAAGTLNADLSVSEPTNEANAGFVGLQLARKNLSQRLGEPDEVLAARLAVAPIERAAAKQDLAQGKQNIAAQRYEATLSHIRELSKQSFGDEKDLRGEYFKVSQPFIEQRNAMGRVRASAETLALDPNNAQGDVALLFNFLKVLDPGSTVREGEFERARQTAGLPSQIEQMFRKLEDGSTLTPQQRRAVVARSEALYRQGAQNQKRLTRQFEGIARRNDLDPQNVILDISDEDDDVTPPAPADEPGASFLMKDPLSGAPIFVRPDGSTFMVAP